MRDIWLESPGRDGLFAIFQEEEGAGYLFVYKPETKEVLAQIRIYEGGPGLSIHENDLQVIWSADYRSCGVAVWGQMRGIINLADGKEKSMPLQNRSDTGITDPDWLQGFSMPSDSNRFIRARQRYWKKMVTNESVDQSADEEVPTITGFIRYEKGPDDCFAVFEDEGETGYLYLYNSANDAISSHLHLYDRSAKVDIGPEDVQVVWSDDLSKCGVVIWGKMRGIIDLKNGREGRVWLQDRNTPGIGDRDWLTGFSY